ncbi:putative bifunctional diguanylate cyclase/phosphodiesterase [Aureimonas altamirensis]|uniref:putative bifunctional diguanylate cyclase/phosphodiesterase n=1 Tax=Aureimonas altamirensis TaxID=370622 RepID=UPI00255372EE|nr:EAL domain-containing protein [Aureimonas altamirensis]
MQSIRRFFPRQYLVPTALLVVTSFGALFSLLYYLTSVQDRLDTERDRQTISSAMQSLVEFAVHDLQDYAVWDDAFRALVLSFDPAWADDNIGVYLGQRQGYTHLFIIENGTSTIYSYDDGSPTAQPMDAFATVGEALRAGVEAAGTAEYAGNTAVGAFTSQGENLFVYAAADLTPLSPGLAGPDGLRRTMVIARPIDGALVDGLSSRYRTGALRLLTDSGTVAGEETVILKSVTDEPVGGVVWAPDNPGTALMHQILPGLMLIALISFFAAGVILNRARLSNEALHSSRANIRFLAYHDALTGLANRSRFLAQLRHGDRRPDQYLLYMDLDGFKEANDVYGHATGDDLLVEAGRRIQRSTPPGSTVARTGGDEFAVLLPGGAPDEPQRTADRVLAAFEPPFHVSSYSVNIGVTIGVARREARLEAEEVMRRADVAMYAAKSRGKRGWLAYEPQQDEANLVRHAMEGALREAMARDEIEVAFQPIVNASTGRIEMVEALARWEHPETGAVAPDHFIRVAEQSGLINELGLRVIAKACHRARDWDIGLSVNLSPVQFWDRNLVGSIIDVLDEARFPTGRLDFEITEKHLLRRPEEAERILGEFRARGIRISLDDFGTGFSSIGYLQRLSLDRIKIDRSFVASAELGGKPYRLAAAIVELGRALDLPVTAEGVENENQAELMRRIGCASLQGWLFGHALSAQEVETRLGMARTDTVTAGAKAGL